MVSDLAADQPLASSSRGTVVGTGNPRVLLVAPEPLGENRGTPIAVANVLRALAELQYEVDVLTYPVGRPDRTDNVRILSTPNPFRIRHVPVGLSTQKLLLDAILVPALWRQLRRQRYDCIHAVEEAAFPAVVLGRRAGVPVIYDMQSSLPEQLTKYQIFRGRRVQALLRRCEAWLLRRADAVVSSAGLLHRISETAPDKLAREWYFPSSPGAVPAGTETRLRAALGIPQTAPVIVYAGTFEPYQGLSILLAALALIVKAVPDAVLVLVGGDGEPAEEIRRESDRLQLSDRIRLLGRKPRAEIPGYFAMADVLVSPRCYGDNLPLKVFDYLAAGRPIVATDLPAHRALLDESRAVLAPPTAEDLSRAVIEVLRDRSRAARLASAARTYAATNLGWPRFVVSVKAIYEEVTRRSWTGATG